MFMIYGSVKNLCFKVYLEKLKQHIKFCFERQFSSQFKVPPF